MKKYAIFLFIIYLISILREIWIIFLQNECFHFFMVTWPYADILANNKAAFVDVTKTTKVNYSQINMFTKYQSVVLHVISYWNISVKLCFFSNFSLIFTVEN